MERSVKQASWDWQGPDSKALLGESQICFRYVIAEKKKEQFTEDVLDSFEFAWK